MSVTAPEKSQEARSDAERIADLERRLAEAEARSPRVEILSEPLTYAAHLVKDKSGPNGLRAIPTRQDYSYIADLARATSRVGSWRDAEERLQQHAREMKMMGERRSALFAPQVDYEFEQRAVSWTNGAGGYFAPPLWIIEQFAIVPTPARVLASLAPQFDLPQGAQSVNLPGWLTGAEVGAAQLDTPPPSPDLTDQAISSAVVTIAGQEDVPMQMLEQSPVGAHLDWAVFTNMEARYGYKLELQLINGTGSATPQGSGNNQLLGILNNTQIPAANIISYTGATTATTMYSYLGQVVAAVGNNRLLPPECWMMRTNRVGWLATSEDQQNRPLIIADNNNATGEFDLATFEVHHNNAIPINLGVAENQDVIIACRPSDWLILESERRTNVYTEVISGTLSARIQMRRYASALLREPTSVSYLTGTGMSRVAGF